MLTKLLTHTVTLYKKKTGDRVALDGVQFSCANLIDYSLLKQ
jgi:hypothetical protein